MFDINFLPTAFVDGLIKCHPFSSNTPKCTLINCLFRLIDGTYKVTLKLSFMSYLDVYQCYYTVLYNAYFYGMMNNLKLGY